MSLSVSSCRIVSFHVFLCLFVPSRVIKCLLVPCRALVFIGKMCDGGHHHCLLIRQVAQRQHLALRGGPWLPPLKTGILLAFSAVPVPVGQDTGEPETTTKRVSGFTMGMRAIPLEPPSPVYEAPCSQSSRTSLRCPLKKRPSLTPTARDAPSARATVAPGGWLSERPSSDTARNTTTTNTSYPLRHQFPQKPLDFTPVGELAKWTSDKGCYPGAGGVQKRNRPPRPSVTDEQDPPVCH